MSSVKIDSVEGAAYKLRISAGKHELTCDQPVSVGGSDEGPNPKELLLAALGACVAQTIAMVAARKKWDLRSISVNLRFEKPGSASANSSSVKHLIKEDLLVEGDLSEEQLAEIEKLAARCPVYKLLLENKTVETTVSLKTETD